MINKIIKYRWILRSMFSTIYFNFHYLPCSQAIKLPIILYKPKLLACKGSLEIRGKVRFGMIQLGRNMVSLYPNNGIRFENYGNIIFNGGCHIGNDSAISVAKTGNCFFGSNFIATTSIKIASYCSVSFGSNVLCGWNCIITDTDFHQLATLSGKKVKAFAPITIGNDAWLGMNTVVLKNTVLPSKCVVASNSLLNKKYDVPELSLLAGQPAAFKKEGVYRDVRNDKINY